MVAIDRALASPQNPAVTIRRFRALSLDSHPHQSGEHREAHHPARHPRDQLPPSARTGTTGALSENGIPVRSPSLLTPLSQELSSRFRHSCDELAWRASGSTGARNRVSAGRRTVLRLNRIALKPAPTLAYFASKGRCE